MLPNTKTPRVTRHTPLCYLMQRPFRVTQHTLPKLLNETFFVLPNTLLCVTQYKDLSCFPAHAFVLLDTKIPRVTWHDLAKLSCVTWHTSLCYTIQRPLVLTDASDEKSLVLLDTFLYVSRYKEPSCFMARTFMFPDTKIHCVTQHNLAKFSCYPTQLFVLPDTKSSCVTRHTQRKVSRVTWHTFLCYLIQKPFMLSSIKSFHTSIVQNKIRVFMC